MSILATHATPDNSIRLASSTGAFFPYTATEASIPAAARLGFRDVEVMLQTAGEYDPPFFSTLQVEACAADVTIYAVHVMHGCHPVFDPYRRRTEEGWLLFQRAVEGAQRLGAETLIWHGACRTPGGVMPDTEIAIEAVDRLAGLCKNAGIRLALENVSWCFLAQTRDVLAFAAQIPKLTHAGSIGFAFDPFQAAEAGATPFMILTAMEDRLFDVHLRDHRRLEPKRRDLLPGAGDLPWPALIRAIANTGYRGPMAIEGALGDTPDQAVAGVRSLLQPLIDKSAVAHAGCDGALPPGVLEGIDLFNRREFYECHEVIEHEWHAERGPIRRLYQGILQIGVGFHHARGGNHRGAVLLLSDGIAKVAEFQPACCGIDTASLVHESQRCLEVISATPPESGGSFDADQAPKIIVTAQRAGSDTVTEHRSDLVQYLPD